MSEGLIEKIKNAEKTAAEKKSQAEQWAEQHLKTLHENHRNDCRDLESLFIEKKKQIHNLAEEKAETALTEKRKTYETLKKTIQQKGTGHQNEALNYIIQTILE